MNREIRGRSFTERKIAIKSRMRVVYRSCLPRSMSKERNSIVARRRQLTRVSPHRSKSIYISRDRGKGDRSTMCLAPLLKKFQPSGEKFLFYVTFLRCSPKVPHNKDISSADDHPLRTRGFYSPSSLLPSPLPPSRQGIIRRLFSRTSSISQYETTASLCREERCRRRRRRRTNFQVALSSSGHQSDGEERGTPRQSGSGKAL